MKTSPNEPTDAPSWYSSVLASCSMSRPGGGERKGAGGPNKVSSGSDVKSYRARLRAHLQVHVVVGGYQVTFVLHPPLEAHVDWFSRQVGEERLGVDRL